MLCSNVGVVRGITWGCAIIGRLDVCVAMLFDLLGLLSNETNCMSPKEHSFVFLYTVKPPKFDRGVLYTEVKAWDFSKRPL